MEHFGVNSYAKRSTKIDSRFYRSRKAVVNEYVELVEGKMEVVEKMEMVEPSASKPYVPDGFDRLQYLKKLGGVSNNQPNYSKEEIVRKLEQPNFKPKYLRKKWKNNLKQ